MNSLLTNAYRQYGHCLTNEQLINLRRDVMLSVVQELQVMNAIPTTLLLLFFNFLLFFIFYLFIFL